MDYQGDNRDENYGSEGERQVAANESSDYFREETHENGRPSVNDDLAGENYPASSSCFSVAKNDSLEVDDFVEKIKHDAENKAALFHQRAAERAAKVRQQLDNIRKNDNFQNNILENPAIVAYGNSGADNQKNDFNHKTSVYEVEDRQTLVNNGNQQARPWKQQAYREEREPTAQKETLTVVQQEKTTGKTEAKVRAHSIQKIETEKQKVTYEKEYTSAGTKPGRTIGQKVRDILLALIQ